MFLSKAKNILENEGYTCVLLNNTDIYTSREPGIKPLIQLIKRGDIPEHLYVADRVVGKAAAYLYVLLKIRALYSQVITDSAISVLHSFHIQVQYDTLVPNIINREGSGICPFEEAVTRIDDPLTAYDSILEKAKQLKIIINV